MSKTLPTKDFSKFPPLLPPLNLNEVQLQSFEWFVGEGLKELFAEVSKLAPFGVGNPKPLFRVNHVILTEVRRFGREESHIEVRLECRKSGVSARGFEFFRTPEDFSLSPLPGREAQVIGTIERDSFRGGLAIRLVDIVSPGVPPTLNSA